MEKTLKSLSKIVIAFSLVIAMCVYGKNAFVFLKINNEKCKMFKTGASYIFTNRFFSPFSSSQINRLLYVQVTMKSDDAFNNIKWDEHLAKKAVDLIFSDRKYPDFTSEEKKIVDSYQEKLLEVDGGTILPNTGADIEQQEIQQILLMRKNLKK